MGRNLLVSLALAALTAAPAQAAPRSEVAAWDCFVDGVALTHGEGGAPDTYTALVTAYAVVSSESGEPASADLTCSLYVDGVLDTVVTASGTTVVAGVEPTEITADPLAEIDVCVTVDFTSDDTPTYAACGSETQEEIPAREYWDAAYAVVSLVPGGAEALCAAVLAAERVTPDVLGTFGIGEDGTIAVGSKTSGWAACPDGT